MEMKTAIFSLLLLINLITAMPFEGAKCGYEVGGKCQYLVIKFTFVRLKN